jgi:hypothetical protein
MMKNEDPSYVFYISQRRQVISTPFDTTVIILPDNTVAFIRAEVFNGDMLEALDHATPTEEETVLNTWRP